MSNLPVIIAGPKTPRRMVVVLKEEKMCPYCKAIPCLSTCITKQIATLEAEMKKLKEENELLQGRYDDAMRMEGLA